MKKKKINVKITKKSEVNSNIKKEVKETIKKKLNVKIPKVDISLKEPFITGDKPKIKHTEYTIYK